VYCEVNEINYQHLLQYRNSKPASSAADSKPPASKKPAQQQGMGG